MHSTDNLYQATKKNFPQELFHIWFWSWKACNKAQDSKTRSLHQDSQVLPWPAEFLPKSYFLMGQHITQVSNVVTKYLSPFRSPKWDSELTANTIAAIQVPTWQMPLQTHCNSTDSPQLLLQKIISLLPVLVKCPGASKIILDIYV